MGKLITHEASIAAASQFLGTEFSAAPHTRGASLRLKEVNLAMGTESKTFRIEKRNAAGQIVVLIQQSVNSMGVPAASTAEAVLITGGEFETLLEPGEQIQIVTTGATSAMRAKLYFEEVIFSKDSSPLTSTRA